MMKKPPSPAQTDLWSGWPARTAHLARICAHRRLEASLEPLQAGNALTNRCAFYASQERASTFRTSWPDETPHLPAGCAGCCTCDAGNTMGSFKGVRIANMRSCHLRWSTGMSRACRRCRWSLPMSRRQWSGRMCIRSICAARTSIRKLRRLQHRQAPSSMRSVRQSCVPDNPPCCHAEHAGIPICAGRSRFWHQQCIRPAA